MHSKLVIVTFKIFRIGFKLIVEGVNGVEYFTANGQYFGSLWVTVHFLRYGGLTGLLKIRYRC